MHNEIIAALLLLAGGGVFLFTRSAQGSLSSLDIDTIFDPAKQNNNDTAQSNPVVDERFIKDQDILARTIWGEARGQGFAGMQAVASVVLNRFKASQVSTARANQFGRSISDICQKPYQFSVWNKNDPNRAKLLSVDESDKNFVRAITIASRAMHGDLPDNTGGADHYLNVSVTMKLRGGTLPSWADLKQKTVTIGDHTFLNLA